MYNDSELRNVNCQMIKKKIYISLKIPHDKKKKSLSTLILMQISEIESYTYFNDLLLNNFLNSINRNRLK